EAAESVVIRHSSFANNSVSDKEQRTKDEELLTIDVLNGIASLIENSLLVQTETKDGESRFRFLEVVREYAIERWR
ncbi:MAG: hypothetical protein M3Q99_17545, partial [Acidobacteriota bacterium]|nr:hypothetical protein [Acidobacteriota bacterium]